MPARVRFVSGPDAGVYGSKSLSCESRPLQFTHRASLSVIMQKKSSAVREDQPKDPSVGVTETDKSGQSTRGKAPKGHSGKGPRPTPVTTLCCDTTTSEMDTSPNTVDSAGDVAGFVRNTSVGEEELEAFNAPEVAVDEERKLREERERREGEMEAKVGKEGEDGDKAVLEEGKYAQVRCDFLIFMLLMIVVPRKTSE